MDLLIGSIFAVFIAIYLIFIKEKYKTKNFKDLWLSILAGILMCFFALIFEKTLLYLFELNDFFDAFIIYAATEEGFKFLSVYLLIFKSKEFSSPYDVIKIVLLTSLTFASIENILYVNFYYKEIGMDVALLRIYTAIPLHAICGISMGYFIYNYKKTKNKLFLLLSILIPLMIHGSYDYFIITDMIYYSLFVLIISLVIHIIPAKKYFT